MKLVSPPLCVRRTKPPPGQRISFPMRRDARAPPAAYRLRRFDAKAKRGPATGRVAWHHSALRLCWRVRRTRPRIATLLQLHGPAACGGRTGSAHGIAAQGRSGEPRSQAPQRFGEERAKLATKLVPAKPKPAAVATEPKGAHWSLARGSLPVKVPQSLILQCSSVDRPGAHLETEAP